MSDTGQKSVLARKADLVRSRGPRKATRMDYGALPTKAIHRAVKRAGVPFAGLDPEPSGETVTWDQTLAEVTENLPEGGLLVVLEGEERARGILHLHQAVLDSLIEVQTTGSVDTVEGSDRPATQIDAALSRDYIDLVLSAFENELEDMNVANIVMRMHFGAVILDRKQLPLLVPERGFHVFQMQVALAGGIKSGSILLALPGTQTAAASWPKRGPDPIWRSELHRTVSQARVTLSSVLLRRRISLKDALALKPGAVIPFDGDCLADVRLEDQKGRAVMRGRLGQAGGNRALRLSVAALEGSDQQPADLEYKFGGSELGPEDTGATHAMDGGLDLGGDDGGLPPLGAEDGGLPPLGDDGGLPPLDGDGGLPPLGEGGGLPPLGDDGGLPPLDGDGGLPPLGEGGGLPPLGEDGGLPPLGGDGGLPPLGGDGGLPPLGGDGGLPPLGGDGGLPDLPPSG